MIDVAFTEAQGVRGKKNNVRENSGSGIKLSWLMAEIRRKHQLSLVVKLSIIYGPGFSTIQRVGFLARFLNHQQ